MYKKNTANWRIYTSANLCKPLLMRLCAIMMLICIHLSVSAFGQKVTINRNNVSVATVIKEIRRQSGYNFLYDAGALSNTPRISVQANDASLEELLEKTFEDLALDYVIRDKEIGIRHD